MREREKEGERRSRADACSTPEVSCRGARSLAEEVASFPPTPHSCRCFDALEDLLRSIHCSRSHLVPFPSLLQIWVRKTSDSTKMRIYLGQLQRGLFVIRRRSAAWLSTVFFPWTFFWSGFWFCFLPNRKFLTWELLLGLGNCCGFCEALWWQPLSLCVAPSCLDLFQPAVTKNSCFGECRKFDLLISSFFFAYTLSFFFFFKLPLSLKGLFFFF